MTERGSPDIEALRRSMEEAADRGDFESAAKLRDRISLLRNARHGDPPDDFDSTGLVRQKAGAMGLGTSRQRVTPPPGWTPPKKPDPMTAGRSRSRRKGKAVE